MSASHLLILGGTGEAAALARAALARFGDGLTVTTALAPMTMDRRLRRMRRTRARSESMGVVGVLVLGELFKLRIDLGWGPARKVLSVRGRAFSRLGADGGRRGEVASLATFPP